MIARHILYFPLALALLVGSSAKEPSPTPPPVTEIFDDAAYLAKIEAEATKIIEAKTSPSLADLKAQLTRANHPVDLPKPTTARLAPELLYAQARASVVAVSAIYQCKECTKWHANPATGFVIAPGVIATNHHVVADTESDEKTLVVSTADGRTIPVKEVLAANGQHDVAFLSVPDLELPALPLAASRAAVGTPIWCIGHPDGNFYHLGTGHVARLAYSDLPTGRTPQMIITADFGQGASGGPILDPSGNVVGMVVSTSGIYAPGENEEEPDDVQMVLRYCVLAESIRALAAPAPEKK